TPSGANRRRAARRCRNRPGPGRGRGSGRRGRGGARARQTMTDAPGQTASPQLATAAAETAEESVGRGAARAQLGIPLLLGVAGVGCYAGIIASGAIGWAIALTVLLVMSQPLDFAIANNEYVRAVLARAQLGIATRTTVRELAALALVLGVGWTGPTDRRITAG